MKKVITDLEIEKRMDRISNKAQADLKKSYQEKPILDKKIKRVSLGLDPVTLDRRDTAIERKLDKISNNSIIALGGDIPVRDYGAVPDSVVDEYLQKAKSGETKLIGVSYIPDLEAEPQYPFARKDIEARDDVDKEHKRLLGAHSQLLGEIAKRNASIEENKNKLNYEISKVNALTKATPKEKISRRATILVLY